MSAEDSFTQLFVLIKLYHGRGDASQLPSKPSPFVLGSPPFDWDASAAIAMVQVAERCWEIGFVLPSTQAKLDFKFIIKDHENPIVWVMKDNPIQVILRGNKEEVAHCIACFEVRGSPKKLELEVSVQVDPVSVFSLASSWKAYKEQRFEADEWGKYEAQVPKAVTNAAIQHPEDAFDDANVSPTFLDPKWIETSDVPKITSRKPFPSKRSVSVQDLVVLSAESLNTSAISATSNAFVDLNELPATGPPMPLHQSEKDYRIPQVTAHDLYAPKEITFDGENEDTINPISKGGVPVMSEQLLVPKERRRLAIIMVGLPARGKTFTAAKLTRYLRWLGHVTKHFNVGKYRRLIHGCNQSSNFFRSDNQEGVDARNEVAALAMDDMLAWMQRGGQIGIFDATNSTRERRRMLLKMAEGECKVIFLEILCNDQKVIDRNIRLKVQQSPDYVDMPDLDEALNDFKTRLANYEKAYEPVAEGSYVKMIDTVRGEGGQLQINSISGYLPGRIVFFLVNTHTNPRPILLTRSGESLGILQNRVGGDQQLSPVGEVYGCRLAAFLKKRLMGERTASVWTSTLQRTISTAQHLIDYPKVEWRALDDINVGICDGMTAQEIKDHMGEEFEARTQDKLHYRYPRGESYLDVIQRLEPVIIELERQQSPVVIIAHQAVLRSLYGYFADKPLEEIPRIDIPLHTVIEIQMGLVGVEEKRYKLI